MTPEYFNFPDTSIPGVSQTVATGPWVTISGQLAFANGVLIGKDDPVAQAKQCFANVAAALALAGCGLSDVVKLTCFLKDASVYPAYAAIKSSLFVERAPAGTAVIVAGLLLPEALLEIEATAVRRWTRT
jgi:enamine deaminase RidA (YjgF/YER057c/UK114 family)